MISFIVPVKNELAYTRGFVESVHATNPATEIEWVVVDSGSTDGTLEYCAEIGARVVPFRRDPFNYCAAVNAGAAVATGHLWIIANNDLLFRSQSDLERLERLFREWPVLAVASPGRAWDSLPEDLRPDLEFKLDGVNGATWAVRPDAFRGWGGMPEGMSGYGYDELFTAVMCWRHGWANAWLTGWDVLHYGSVTFGPLGGNVTPAMRRNLSRLLSALDAEDLDHPRRSPAGILQALRKRELERAPVLLASPEHRPQVRQGFAGIGSWLPRAEAWSVVSIPSPPCQWAPWLANEIRLQPGASCVGNAECLALSPAAQQDQVATQDLARVREWGSTAQAVGPPPSPLLPPIPVKRPTLRQRVWARLHDWRHRADRLPDGW